MDMGVGGGKTGFGFKVHPPGGVNFWGGVFLESGNLANLKTLITLPWHVVGFYGAEPRARKRGF